MIQQGKEPERPLRLGQREKAEAGEREKSAIITVNCGRHVTVRLPVEVAGGPLRDIEQERNQPDLLFRSLSCEDRL